MNHTMLNAGSAMNQCVKSIAVLVFNLRDQVSILQTAVETRRSEQDLC
jgi:hypothetical protein